MSNGLSAVHNGVMFPIKAFAPHVTSELRFLCDPVTWERCESCNLAVGDEEDVRRCTVPSHPRNRQPKPVNAGNGAPEPARHGAIHVRVDTGGEDHRSADGAACKSRHPSFAVGVTILHLAMTGRASPGPFIVLLWLEKKHNWLIDADTQLMGAASRLVLVAGHRQR